MLTTTSQLWRFWHTTRGRTHLGLQKMHAKYGPVFRVSPNELSFATETAFRTIYGNTGHQQSGKSSDPHGGEPLLFPKGDIYDMLAGAYESRCISSVREPAEHARMKRMLAAVFSPRALAEQEPIVQRCIDGFVDKIGRVSRREGKKGIDLVDWMDMIAFDILGEMSFGESFGCVQSEKVHGWIDILLRNVKEVIIADNLRRVRVLELIGKWLLPWVVSGVRNKHADFSRAKVQKRLEAEAAYGLASSESDSHVPRRQDFMTPIADKVRAGQVSQEEMSAHASIIVTAGAETTSTSVSASLYYLLKNPSTMEKLKAEVRGSWDTYADIDAASAMQLPYLRAVMDESMRVHPPGPQGFSRNSPGCAVDGIWVPKGTEVYTSTWTLTHDSRYFHEPDSFIPERWLDPNCQDVKEAHQPFLIGSRACIGRK